MRHRKTESGRNELLGWIAASGKGGDAGVYLDHDGNALHVFATRAAAKDNCKEHDARPVKVRVVLEDW